MTQTKQQHWLRRGQELRVMHKAELCTLYRSLGGLGGTYPPERWTKDELVTAVVDIEWGRLPADSKQPAPEQMSPPCDTCGKGQDVAAHAHGGSHHYSYTADPGKPWVPSREPCAAPTPEPCGRPYEHHEAWNLGHSYQAPAEEQPAPRGPILPFPIAPSATLAFVAEARRVLPRSPQDGSAAPAAGATVDISKPYAYRCDRVDQRPPQMLSYGTQMATWDLMRSPEYVAQFQAAQTRIGHSYYGPLMVSVWQHRGDDEHYRAEPPEDAWTVILAPTDRQAIDRQAAANGWDKL